MLSAHTWCSEAFFAIATAYACCIRQRMLLKLKCVQWDMPVHCVDFQA